MATLDELKEAANPYKQLKKAVEEGNQLLRENLQANKDNLQANKDNLQANKDILVEKKNNHAVWYKASKHRRYINIIAVLVTVAILWLDVLKLNPDSEIVGSVIGVTKVVAGFFL